MYLKDNGNANAPPRGLAEAVYWAVLSGWLPQQRAAILESWVDLTELDQGYESVLASWLRTVAAALRSVVEEAGDDG